MQRGNHRGAGNVLASSPPSPWDWGPWDASTSGITVAAMQGRKAGRSAAGSHRPNSAGCHQGPPPPVRTPGRILPGAASAVAPVRRRPLAPAPTRGTSGLPPGLLSSPIPGPPVQRPLEAAAVAIGGEAGGMGRSLRGGRVVWTGRGATRSEGRAVRALGVGDVWC
jgi:hypothetical protein